MATVSAAGSPQAVAAFFMDDASCVLSFAKRDLWSAMAAANISKYPLSTFEKAMAENGRNDTSETMGPAACRQFDAPAGRPSFSLLCQSSEQW